jgi:hypothetical protein
MKQQQKIKRSFSHQATYWLGVIAVGLTVGLGIQFAQAWTNPGQAPEQGNIPGPITTGASAQTKTGSFTTNGNLNANGWVIANGAMQGQYFRDLNDPLYYVDPTSWSRMVNVGANHYHSYGNVHADGAMNAHDYYIRAIGKWASHFVDHQELRILITSVL